MLNDNLYDELLAIIGSDLDYLMENVEVDASSFSLETMGILMHIKDTVKDWNLKELREEFIEKYKTADPFEYNTAGTLSGNPSIVLAQGYVFSSTGTKGVVNKTLTQRIPITLDAAGAVRLNGTLSFAASGQGGTSATRVVFNWIEIR